MVAKPSHLEDDCLLFLGRELLALSCLMWSKNRARCPRATSLARFMINQARRPLAVQLHASLYICEIATHGTLSLPLRLRRLPLVVLQEAT
jgi:hypothetical protein